VSLDRVKAAIVKAAIVKEFEQKHKIGLDLGGTDHLGFVTGFLHAPESDHNYTNS
jgi:hypothetical protein